MKCWVSKTRKIFTVEPLGHGSLALVVGALVILVLDGDERAPLDQVLSDVVIVPEAGVVKRGVTVLVHKVHVGFVLQKLGRKKIRENDSITEERAILFLLPC